MAERHSNTTADPTKTDAQTAADQAKAGAAALADAAREKAGEIAVEARQRAVQYGEETKNMAAEETSKVAQALRRASQELRDGSPQERVFATLADNVAEFADSMRGMDLADMGREATRFARTHPAAFLGGAALAGFMATRFLKASARSGQQQPQHGGAAMAREPGQSAHGAVANPTPAAPSKGGATR